MNSFVGNIFTSNNIYDGGAYYIAGQVTNDPGLHPVRLHDRRSGRLIAATWCDPTTGNYSFSRLRNGDFYAVAFDLENQLNCAVADHIPVEIIP